MAHMNNFVWIESTPAQHYTAMLAGTAEGEDLNFPLPDANRDGLHGVVTRKQRRYRIRSLVAEIFDDDGGGIADQGMDFLFCAENDYAGAGTSHTSTSLGIVRAPTGAGVWLNTAGSLWEWSAHDIELDYFDNEEAYANALGLFTNFPRLHLYIIPATGGDMAAADTFRIRVGCEPL